MTTATIIIIFGMGMIAYANYIYKVHIIDDFKAFPEPVAAKLRRAIYYTNISVEPKNAIKYYRQALALADEMGIDPFSDPILGVKIQLSNFYEKLYHYRKAIEVLEIVRSDCLKWLDLIGGREGREGDRTRILGKTIQISIKLGEYYANEQVDEQEAAEEKLVWAVTAVLKEQKRREEEGVKPGEGHWMSEEEIGGALESLGNHYETHNKHYLAAPLFLQALGLSPPNSCHSVILMNNLAISLALQNPPPAPNLPPTLTSEYLSQASVWAKKALSTAAAIKPPERTEECDEGCAVATINLGDFAMMGGEVREARRRWEEGRGISKGIGFGEGVGRAEESLKELEREKER